MGRSQIRRQGEGGRVGAMRKTEPEKTSHEGYAGGGKNGARKGSYKDRKDIGTQKNINKSSTTTKEAWIRWSINCEISNVRQRWKDVLQDLVESTPTSAKDKDQQHQTSC